MSRADAIAEARRLTLARGDALVRLHAHAERFVDLDENLDLPDRDHGLRLLAATVVEAHARYRIADERHRDQVVRLAALDLDPDVLPVVERCRELLYDPATCEAFTADQEVAQ